MRMASPLKMMIIKSLIVAGDEFQNDTCLAGYMMYALPDEEKESASIGIVVLAMQENSNSRIYIYPLTGEPISPPHAIKMIATATAHRTAAVGTIDGESCDVGELMWVFGERCALNMEGVETIINSALRTKDGVKPLCKKCFKIGDTSEYGEECPHRHD